jgi:hypothetical protein
LRIAAESGDPAAQYQFSQKVSDVVADGRVGADKDFYFLNNPAALQEGADTARRYLDNLDHLCNEQALYATYISYGTGFLHLKNPANEYLYLQILKKTFHESAIESAAVNMDDLSANQIGALDQMADKYISAYCN